jgi:hypothetical protein
MQFLKEEARLITVGAVKQYFSFSNLSAYDADASRSKVT